MSTKINMVGRQVGRLTVLEEAGRIRKEVLWKCRCDCGNITYVSGYYLRAGHTQSCGCLTAENRSNYRHGLYGSRIHSIYTNMKTRCYNPNYHLFHRYGGRGITICDEWLGKDGLQNFWKWSTENGYSEEKSIDRIDNDKGYSPDNCRWVSMKDQQNNRSNNRLIEVNGITKTMKQWAEGLHVNYGVLQRQVARGKETDFIRGLLNGTV